MPSSVAAQLSRKMDRAATELRRSQRTALTSGLTELKQGVDRRLPASKRLRGAGPKGAKVGVRYDFIDEKSGVVKATGPLHLLERDTKPHIIRAKKYKGTRGSGKRAQKGAALMAAFGLDANDGGAIAFNGMVRNSVQHPGTKGQHPFAKGIEDAKPRALRAMRDPVSAAIKKGLRNG